MPAGNMVWIKKSGVIRNVTYINFKYAVFKKKRILKSIIFFNKICQMMTLTVAVDINAKIIEDGGYPA